MPGDKVGQSDTVGHKAETSSEDDEKIEERPLEPTPASHLVPGQVQKPS